MGELGLMVTLNPMTTKDTMYMIDQKTAQELAEAEVGAAMNVVVPMVVIKPVMVTKAAMAVIMIVFQIKMISMDAPVHRELPKWASEIRVRTLGMVEVEVTQPVAEGVHHLQLKKCITMGKAVIPARG